MEKLWLKSYMEGVPAEIDLNTYSSLADLFEQGIAKYRDKVAYVSMGIELTYADVDRLSRDFAAWLQSVVKLPKGARVVSTAVSDGRIVEDGGQSTAGNQ